MTARQPGAAIVRDFAEAFTPSEAARLSGARYSVLRADCAGSETLMVTNDLAEAAALLGALRTKPTAGRIYLVTDEERDGRTLTDEELGQ